MKEKRRVFTVFNPVVIIYDLRRTPTMEEYKTAVKELI
jgi:hypothetical protein